MRYLITTPDHPPFFTQDFDPVNHYSPGITAIDIHNNLYYDGHSWVEIKWDQL